jgi:alcohol dehydrogenase class IV
VADECLKAGMKNVLLVTTGLKGTGIVDEIEQILKSNGVVTHPFDKVSSNPKDTEVAEGFTMFQAAECDGVVSIGGGSSHDAGKGIRALTANPEADINDMAAKLDPPWMEVLAKYKPCTVPQVSVNTTAGTGAESTFGGAIINTKVPSKNFIVIPGLAPTTAIYDPYLVRIMPQHIAAQTGFDALSHAFESYVARLSTPFNQGVMIHAIKLIAENLREFSANRMNYKACENMCWAACMAGVGLGFGGGVGLVHGLGHGLSVLCNVHHGLANAAVALGMERYNQSACPDRFGEMAWAMGVDTNGLSKMQASDKWFDEIERLLGDLDIQSGHLSEQFGLKKEDCPHIVTHQYANDFAREGNPRDYVFDDCVKLLEDQL